MVDQLSEVNDGGKNSAPQGLTALDAYNFKNAPVQEITPMPTNPHAEQQLNSTNFSITDLNDSKDSSDSDENRRTHSDDVADAALNNVGKLLWDKSPNANILADGKLSAAASVSEVLKQTGVPVDEASVKGLADRLQNVGWEQVPLDQAKPGDVIVGLGQGGRNGDAGIVGADGKIYASKTFAQGDDGKYGHWASAGPGRLSQDNPRWKEPNGRLMVLRQPDTCDE